MITFGYPVVLTVLTIFFSIIVCRILWLHFKPLTPYEQKIFDSFNIAIQNSERAHIEYTTWHNKEGEYRVCILDMPAIVVSNKLGRILTKIHSEHWNKIRKTERSMFVEAIYAELTKKYPDAAHRIENGSFKGSTTPASPRPDAPQPPVSSEEKQTVASKTLYDM